MWTTEGCTRAHATTTRPLASWYKWLFLYFSTLSRGLQLSPGRESVPSLRRTSFPTTSTWSFLLFLLSHSLTRFDFSIPKTLLFSLLLLLFDGRIRFSVYNLQRSQFNIIHRKSTMLHTVRKVRAAGGAIFKFTRASASLISSADTPPPPPFARPLLLFRAFWFLCVYVFPEIPDFLLLIKVRLNILSLALSWALWCCLCCTHVIFNRVEPPLKGSFYFGPSEKSYFYEFLMGLLIKILI